MNFLSCTEQHLSLNLQQKLTSDHDIEMLIDCIKQRNLSSDASNCIIGLCFQCLRDILQNSTSPIPLHLRTLASITFGQYDAATLEFLHFVPGNTSVRQINPCGIAHRANESSFRIASSSDFPINQPETAQNCLDPQTDEEGHDVLHHLLGFLQERLAELTILANEEESSQIEDLLPSLKQENRWPLSIESCLALTNLFIWADLRQLSGRKYPLVVRITDGHIETRHLLNSIERLLPRLRNG